MKQKLRTSSMGICAMISSRFSSSIVVEVVFVGMVDVANDRVRTCRSDCCCGGGGGCRSNRQDDDRNWGR